jgi:hypothetical protein
MSHKLAYVIQRPGEFSLLKMRLAKFFQIKSHKRTAFVRSLINILAHLVRKQLSPVCVSLMVRTDSMIPAAMKFLNQSTAGRPVAFKEGLAVLFC